MAFDRTDAGAWLAALSNGGVHNAARVKAGNRLVDILTQKRNAPKKISRRWFIEVLDNFQRHFSKAKK